jgi:hypothetical protein
MKIYPNLQVNLAQWDKNLDPGPFFKPMQIHNTEKNTGSRIQVSNIRKKDQGEAHIIKREMFPNNTVRYSVTQNNTDNTITEPRKNARYR